MFVLFWTIATQLLLKLPFLKLRKKEKEKKKEKKGLLACFYFQRMRIALSTQYQTHLRPFIEAMNLRDFYPGQ